MAPDSFLPEPTLMVAAALGVPWVVAGGGLPRLGEAVWTSFSRRSKSRSAGGVALPLPVGEAGRGAGWAGLGIGVGRGSDSARTSSGIGSITSAWASCGASATGALMNSGGPSLTMVTGTPPGREGGFWKYMPRISTSTNSPTCRASDPASAGDMLVVARLLTGAPRTR